MKNIYNYFRQLNKKIKQQNKKIFRKILISVIPIIFFTKKKKAKNRKLLIIRIDAIGDFIIFSPMLKYYRKLYPNYKITLLINEINKELAERFNFVDEIITIDRKKTKNSIFYLANTLIKLNKKAFDIVIYPTYSREPIGDLLVKASGAKEKIGFNGDLSNISKEEKQKNNQYYTKLINPEPGIKLETERNKEFIESLDKIVVNNYIPFFNPSSSDEKKAIGLLNKNGLKKVNKFVVICIGGLGNKRKWPLQKYCKIIDYLKKRKSVEIVICGSKNDQVNACTLENITNHYITNITGKTSLPVLAAILKKSLLYIGNDTGPAHLSAAVENPTICIMGGGHFGRFFPYGNLNKNKIVYHKMPCFGCNWNCKYRTTKCIENISVKQVIDKINEII